jgi:hypothetical protein
MCPKSLRKKCEDVEKLLALSGFCEGWDPSPAFGWLRARNGPRDGRTTYGAGRDTKRQTTLLSPYLFGTTLAPVPCESGTANPTTVLPQKRPLSGPFAQTTPPDATAEAGAADFSAASASFAMRKKSSMIFGKRGLSATCVRMSTPKY